MQNLRDLLLKAGVVSKEEAQKAEEEAKKPKPRPERARPPSSAPRSAPPRPARAAQERHERPQRPNDRRPAKEPAIPKLPPMPGSREYQRIESAKQREIDRQLREWVLTNQVAPESGEHTFYFVTRKGRLRRLEISPAQAKLLEDGKLAVVERQDPDKIEHAMVPVEIAEKMHALFPKAVRFLNKEGAAVGFISEDELKQRQEAEASAPPESEEKTESAESSPAQVETEAAPETWIEVKRA